MKREAKGRGMKGVRDNNQMNDSIQVFGFARQPIATSTPCSSQWYQTTLALLAATLKKHDSRLWLGEMIK